MLNSEQKTTLYDIVAWIYACLLRYLDRQIATLFREVTIGLKTRIYLFVELQNKVHYLRARAGLYQLSFSRDGETVG